MEISQKVDVIGYPVEPLRVEMRNGAVKANVEVTDLPFFFMLALFMLAGVIASLNGTLCEIRDAIRDLKPPAHTAPVDAPKPPK